MIDFHVGVIAALTGAAIATFFVGPLDWHQLAVVVLAWAVVVFLIEGLNRPRWR